MNKNELQLDEKYYLGLIADNEAKLKRSKDEVKRLAEYIEHLEACIEFDKELLNDIKSELNRAE